MNGGSPCFCLSVTNLRAKIHSMQNNLSVSSAMKTVPTIPLSPLFAISKKFGAAFIALAFPLMAQAAGAVLLQGPEISVTTDDVQIEMQRMPMEVQQRLLITPPQMRQLINNIYLRRAAAQAAERQGLTQDPTVQYRLQMARENTLGEAWINAVNASVKPTEQQLDTYAKSTYKAEPKRFEIPAESRARHILLMGKTPDNLAAAEKLLQELKAGANFEEMAKQHSKDPGNATKGGDLGWFPKGRMVKEFDDAVDALKNPGDISDVVTTQFGYHIIKFEGRKPAVMREYSEVREQLYAEALAKLQQEARTIQIEKLQSQIKGDETALQSFIESEKSKHK